MAARWATIYKLRKIYDHDSKDYEFDTDKKWVVDKRTDLAEPIKALISLAAWTTEKQDLLRTTFIVASSDFKPGPQKRIPTQTLPLKMVTEDGKDEVCAALAMAGTTSELDELLKEWQDDPYKVLTIRAPKNDLLHLAYARIRNKSKMNRVTDTVLVIAPLQWWTKDKSIKRSDDIYPKDPKAVSGWSAFKGSTQTEILQLATLRELLKQGKGQKAWIKAADEYFV